MDRGHPKLPGWLSSPAQHPDIPDSEHQAWGSPSGTSIWTGLNSVCMHTSSMRSPGTKHGFSARRCLEFAFSMECYCTHNAHTLTRASLLLSCGECPLFDSWALLWQPRVASNLPSLKQPAMSDSVISTEFISKSTIIGCFTLIYDPSNSQPCSSCQALWPCSFWDPQSSFPLCTETSVSWNVDGSTQSMPEWSNRVWYLISDIKYLCDLSMTTPVGSVVWPNSNLMT